MTPVGHWNHNIAQLLFWVLTVYLYRRAVRMPSYLAWITLAVSAELLLQTKYTGILLLGTLAAHALWFPEGRAALRRPQALIGIGFACTLFAWQFLTPQDTGALSYFAVNRHPYTSTWDYILNPLSLLGSQLAFHAPVVLLVLVALPYTKAQKERAVRIALPERSAFDTALLVVSTAAPLALGLVFYGVSGVWGRSEAFGSLFMLVGPSVVACAGSVIRIARPKIVLTISALVVLVPVIGNCLDPIIGPRLFHRIGTEQIQFENDASALAADWQYRFGMPLSIIAGDIYTAGGLAAHMHSRPSVLIDGMIAKSPWITRERMRREGALVVWRIKDTSMTNPPSALSQALAGYRVERLTPLRINTRIGEYAHLVVVGRAIIRPSVSFGAER